MVQSIYITVAELYYARAILGIFGQRVTLPCLGEEECAAELLRWVVMS